MQTVSIQEASSNLENLITAARHGEQVVISQGGEPVAKIMAIKPLVQKVAPPGSMKGKIWIDDETFNDPIDDLFDVLRDEPEEE